MEIFTIDCAKTPAVEFFGRLKTTGIRRLLDVRLNNTSQLAAYANCDDLKYFVSAIWDVTYEHEPLLTPTEDMLDAFKKRKGRWQVYDAHFMSLMAKRQIDVKLKRDRFESTLIALLCREHIAEHCHRRLIITYLQEKWLSVRAVHL